MIAVAIYAIGVGGSACIAYAVYKIVQVARGAYDEAASIVLGQ